MPVPIEITEGESQEMLLGQLVQAVNALIVKNNEEHKKIFERLDDGDKYLAVLKFSRCSLHWLDSQGLFKVIGTAILSGAIGYLIAYNL